MKRIFLAAIIALLPAAASAQQVQQTIFRPITSYFFSISGAPVTSAQIIGPQTRVMRVLCSVSCDFAFAVSPVNPSLTAPVTLAPNVKEYFKVTPGLVTYVHANGSGAIYLTEME